MYSWEVTHTLTQNMQR